MNGRNGFASSAGPRRAEARLGGRVAAPCPGLKPGVVVTFRPADGWVLFSRMQPPPAYAPDQGCSIEPGSLGRFSRPLQRGTTPFGCGCSRTWNLEPPGTWTLEPGTLEPWNPGTLEPWNPGPWNLEPGTWNLEPGTLEPWTLDPGTWNLEPGTWNPGTLEPGTWNLEPGTRSQSNPYSLAMSSAVLIDWSASGISLFLTIQRPMTSTSR